MNIARTRVWELMITYLGTKEFSVQHVTAKRSLKVILQCNIKNQTFKKIGREIECISHHLFGARQKYTYKPDFLVPNYNPITENCSTFKLQGEELNSHLKYHQHPSMRREIPHTRKRATFLPFFNKFSLSPFATFMEHYFPCLET